MKAVFLTLFTILFFSCGTESSGPSAANGQASADSGDEVKNITDNRFKLETVVDDRKVKVILNDEAIPTDMYTDVYIKMEGVGPRELLVICNTKEGVITTSKTDHYFAVRAKEGVPEMTLGLSVKKDGEPVKLGEIVLPTINKTK